MKAKMFFLDAALILLLGFFMINKDVWANMALNLRVGQSLEYFSASGRNGVSPVNVYFVKAVFTAFPEACSAVHRSRLVVRPVSLERVAP
jgi:hypothetical protein